jgi:1-acyl-sn-glycerol-3-phosphate acyltransferase
MVANHQSALDAFVFGHLWNVNFKVTFKWELLFYPGYGSCMYLSGYVPVVRGNKSSGHHLLDQCHQLLRESVNVLFFPEGTRKLDDRNTRPMGPFKAGAFKLAMDAQVPIVPITISGARDLMPARGFPGLGFGSVTMTIHKPVETKGKTMDQLMIEVHDVILSGMTKADMILPDSNPSDFLASKIGLPAPIVSKSTTAQEEASTSGKKTE